MNQTFKGWHEVATHLERFATSPDFEPRAGQAASLRALAKRLPENGVIIADEVGMGKTRVAAVVAQAVIHAGGRVAILVPPGLGYQWNDELKIVKVSAPLILRSLRQYLQDWEKPESPLPWFAEQAVVISHSFTNWRLGTSAAAWRWTLLPEIYARWRKYTDGRWPRAYCDNEKLSDPWVQQAAKNIVSEIASCPETSPARKLIQELADTKIWPEALQAEAYGRDEQLRPWLERSVGLGLGVFDLVIIDEAHKSRGQDSGLNRLLNGVILTSGQTRYLAMTATPVELEAAQWTQMLERIRVDEASSAAASQAIANYVKSVKLVRECPSDSNAREEFKVSASDFKHMLDRYVLRRDKREDPRVMDFQKVSGENYHNYRQEQAIEISTSALSTQWKRTVCAAEALSFVSSQADDPISKRLRLTLGNGHGIATLIDRPLADSQENPQDDNPDIAESSLSEPKQTVPHTQEKRKERAEWWQRILIQPFAGNKDSALFDHPAILAAVEEIEAICHQGKKSWYLDASPAPCVPWFNCLTPAKCCTALPRSGHGRNQKSPRKRSGPQLSRHTDNWLWQVN